MERRVLFSREMVLRSADEGVNSPGTLVHHSPPWDTRSVALWTERGKPVYEQFKRGAFANVLASGPDVVGLFNHDSSQLLGRTGPKDTLSIVEDDIGLRYELVLPPTRLGEDVAALVERGDLRGSSFAFGLDDGGDEWDESEGEYLRTVINVSVLADTGPVTWPAYPSGPQGAVGIRSVGGLDDVRLAFASWRSKASGSDLVRRVRQLRAMGFDCSAT